jgi:hypothetical protein
VDPVLGTALSVKKPPKPGIPTAALGPETGLTPWISNGDPDPDTLPGLATWTP